MDAKGAGRYAAGAFPIALEGSYFPAAGAVGAVAPAEVVVGAG